MILDTMSNSSFKSLFPYSTFREGQEDIIHELERSFQLKENVILIAPNGTGKTIIALCSSITSALNQSKKIIYACRTHSQSNRVITELKKINEFSHKKILGISLRGRNEMCLNNSLLDLKLNPREAMQACSELRKQGKCRYFKQLNSVKNEIERDHPLLFDQPLDAPDLIAFCVEQGYCPYFLAKELMKYEDVKVIILNFRWIFDCSIRFQLLKALDLDLEDCILIVDECHNILQVATEVNKAKVNRHLLLSSINDIRLYQMEPLVQKFRTFLKLTLNLLNKRLSVLPLGETAINANTLFNKLLARSKFQNLAEFNQALDLIRKMNVSQRTKDADITQKLKKDVLAPVINFLYKFMQKREEESYFFCYSVFHSRKHFGKKIDLELHSLDPRETTYPVYKRICSSLNLSGTINSDVFYKLTGMNYLKEKPFKLLSLPSPFGKRSFLALITEGVDTANEHRTVGMCKKINEKIYEVIRNTPKNIGIFCASYDIMQNLMEVGLLTLLEKSNKEIFIEKQGNTSSENAYLLKKFKQHGKDPFNGAVLLGVSGGRNSEGEDFPGNLMNAVIIVGIPYEYPSARIKRKIHYYDKMFNNKGWALAYLAPAMQRANQASGRVIRTIKDRGVIVFMDSRFKDVPNWITSWIRPNLSLVQDTPGELAKKVALFFND